MPNYRWIVHKDFSKKLNAWKRKLVSGELGFGKKVSQNLRAQSLRDLSLKDLFEALVNSREPTKYAESEVVGNGSDWTQDELSLMGDMTFACEVEVFDDGKHVSPEVYKKPFTGLLLFMSGALLRNDYGNPIPDEIECVLYGELLPENFEVLIGRRLRPLLKYANRHAKERQTKTVVTIPGVGCGQFAGSVGITHDIAKYLDAAIVRILREEGESLNHIACVRFDPYLNLRDSERKIHGIDYRVRPFLKSMFPRPQLSEIRRLEEEKGEFDKCILSSVVAWDPVSWPGNDFYSGNRSTDDGVKGAATSLMLETTGLKGAYNARLNGYYPEKDEESTWFSLIRKNNIKLLTRNHILAEK